MWIRDGRVLPGAFKNRGALGTPPGMSTNWEKYATAEATRQQAKNPAVQGVIDLVAGSVRGLPGQTVEHTPLDENRAHTDVFARRTKRCASSSRGSTGG
jgi:hypothetical protein